MPLASGDSSPLRTGNPQQSVGNDNVIKELRHESRRAGGANEGGSIHVNLGDRGGLQAEIQYEDSVMTVLEGGGNLTIARQRLELRRRELGLSLVTVRQIETACLELMPEAKDAAAEITETENEKRAAAEETDRREAEQRRAAEQREKEQREETRRREAADQKERERLAREGPAPGTEKTIELPGGVPLVLCWCPATTSESWKRISGGEDFFWMGSPEEELGRNSAEDHHRVRLTLGFWLGKYPVTQRQWEAVWGSNPSRFTESGPEAPVEGVSWEEAQEWLTKANGALGWKVELRLPTEAEWEYGCRAGTTSALNNGKELTSEDEKCLDLGQVGWYNKNSDEKTHPVGQLRPNAWGLHDCHGNVWEWCADWKASYEACDTVTDDPEGPPTGSYRVNRGGSWHFHAQSCRSAFRYSYPPGCRNFNLGIRLALTLSP